MIKELAVATPQDQRAVIRQTTSMASHLGFVLLNRFNDKSGSTYEQQVERQVGPNQPEDYFRLLTLVTTQAAQYGFEGLFGGMTAHAQRNRVLPFFHPTNLLSLTSYLGWINGQAFDIKTKIIEKMEARDREVALKVWQVKLDVDKGIVTDSPLGTNIPLIHWKLAEWPVREPIHLPDTEFNAKLGSLRFTPENADSMPLPQIMSTVVPRAQEAVGDLLDVRKAVEGFRPV